MNTLFIFKTTSINKISRNTNITKLLRNVETLEVTDNKIVSVFKINLYLVYSVICKSYIENIARDIPNSIYNDKS